MAARGGVAAVTAHAPPAAPPPLAASDPVAGGAEVGGSMPATSAPQHTASNTPIWLGDAESELRKIPFFVRGKARRNTEAFASMRGIQQISIDTLYEAKAHYAR